MSSPAENPKAKNNYWWEFYFVRYFVGTIVGGSVIYWLNTSPSTTTEKPLLTGIIQPIDAHMIILYGALGLAYCYIASAPALVLHAARGVWFSDKRRSRPLRYLLLAASLALLVGIVSVAITWEPAKDSGPSRSKQILAIILCAYVLFSQVALLFYALAHRSHYVHGYYLRLVSARTSHALASEYVESYRHLREHGNAFLILVLELALGAILSVCTKPAQMILVLLVWVGPAALVWFVGSNLESHFSRQSSAT